jgi:hypothetical protein
LAIACLGRSEPALLCAHPLDWRSKPSSESTSISACNALRLVPLWPAGRLSAVGQCRLLVRQAAVIDAEGATEEHFAV